MNFFAVLRNAVKRKLNSYKYRKTTPIEMRHDDVYLVSFPRSGNTWLSFILANVMVAFCELKKEVNFFNLHDFIPDIYVSRCVPKDLYFSPFPRIIKSHSNYNPYYKRG